MVDQPSGQLIGEPGDQWPPVTWLWDDGGALTVGYDSDEVDWIPWPRQGGKWYLPSRFSALIERPEIPNAVELQFRVTTESRAICSSLTVWRARTLHHFVQTEHMDDPHDMFDRTVAEISSEGLRKVPASRLVRWAILGACHHAPHAGGRRAEPPSLDEWSSLFATEGKRRRRRLDDAHFREVAAVYRAAVPFGTPTQAVAEHFTAGKSTAGRWVVEARRRGFLGQTVAGRAGEHDSGPDEGEQA